MRGTSGAMAQHFNIKSKTLSKLKGFLQNFAQKRYAKFA